MITSHTVRVALALLCTGSGGASAAAQSARPAPIQDNSFFVEEAYNQEDGVVQHISTFLRAPDAEWSYAFTQEWPVRGQRHQLSYSVPIARVRHAAGTATGVGDIAVNYRYQVGETENARVAFAPRLTVLLPTGSPMRGLGSGGLGVQANLPLSVELPGPLVAHSNLGGTFTPSARSATGDHAATSSITVAQSLVWLTHARLNLLLESFWTRRQEIAGPARTAWTTEALIAPGLRAAFDRPSGLQIVPGVAVPFGIGPSRGERSLLLYLSLEHPFREPAGR